MLSNVISNSTAMPLLSSLRNNIIRSLREEACSDIEIILTRETSTSTDAAIASRKSSCNAVENSCKLNGSPSVILITTDTEFSLHLNPGSHVVQTNLRVPFGDLYIPAAQLHSKTSETPDKSWPEFAGQREQGVLKYPPASMSCHVLGGQGTHADIPASTATLPMGQSVHIDAARFENFPDTHKSHLEEFAVLDNVPAEHPVHA